MAVTAGWAAKRIDRISGVSTRRVGDPVQAMGRLGIGKSNVSKLRRDFDERMNAFLDRPLPPAEHHEGDDVAWQAGPVRHAPRWARRNAARRSCIRTADCRAP